MTGLDIAQVIKDELQRLHVVISQASRRRAILDMAARKLRMGYAPAVVLAEVESQGETLELPKEEERRC